MVATLCHLAHRTPFEVGFLQSLAGPRAKPPCTQKKLLHTDAMIERATREYRQR
jgi:hypothetical protein